MPSDVFWTGLFTFGGGLVGGGAGYATARLQHGMQERQLALEEQRLRGEEVSTGRTQGEKRAEQRRAVYLRYLEAVDGITHPTAHRAIDRKALTENRARLLDAHCEVELAGNEEINEVAYELNDILDSLVAEVGAILDGVSSDDDVAKAVWTRTDAIRGSRRKMIKLMRLDLQVISAGS